MPTAYRVALLGFSEFERTTLASYFRLATHRTPSYEQVPMLTDSDFIVADADHAPSVQLVVATERMAEAVFIGAQAPLGCTAWMTRPIDALHVMRELDAMVALGAASAAAASGERPGSPRRATTVIQPPWRVRPVAVAQVPEAPPLVPARPVAPPSQARPPPQPSALLVDDSEIALRFLESRLQRWGLRIDRASGSGKAIELLAQRSYDFVFLDLELGIGSDLDGMALCQHIKRHPHAGERGPHAGPPAITSVIIVSAHHTELDRVRGALAGCDAFLGKPLDEIELQRLLLRQGLKPKPTVL
jgi:CheY-like chemotaxis protein